MLLQDSKVNSKRVIYTASSFAKDNLLFLQEVGELQAQKEHVSQRENLTSFLFFLVEEGSGLLEYNGQTFNLTKGMSVFIDCRGSYAHSTSADDLWRLKWVHFYGNNLDGIYRKYLERGGLSVYVSEHFEETSQILSDIQTVADSDDYLRDMKINERLNSLLTIIMSQSWHPENSGRRDKNRRQLTDVVLYLEDHYREKITLDDLSGKFFINKYYLTRLFKEQYGTTVLAYLDHIRITQAKEYLRFTDYSAEEIGRMVGIEEPGYFNRVFKKVESITPGEYRKQW